MSPSSWCWRRSSACCSCRREGGACPVGSYFPVANAAPGPRGGMEIDHTHLPWGKPRRHAARPLRPVQTGFMLPDTATGPLRRQEVAHQFDDVLLVVHHRHRRRPLHPRPSLTSPARAPSSSSPRPSPPATKPSAPLTRPAPAPPQALWSISSAPRQRHAGVLWPLEKVFTVR